MVTRSQPRGARGTIARPYSALNLRLLFALFGLVTCLVLGALAVRADLVVPAVIFGVLAAVAAIDLVVVQRRRRARRREEPGVRHSLFE
ncbi:MAG TPA: DUF6343 family protein [Micromonosporaceae bacterium]|nr:DUF6343 family protein [Micromonosporaceae bacterium]